MATMRRFFCGVKRAYILCARASVSSTVSPSSPSATSSSMTCASASSSMRPCAPTTTGPRRVVCPRRSPAPPAYPTRGCDGARSRTVRRVASGRSCALAAGTSALDQAEAAETVRVRGRSGGAEGAVVAGGGGRSGRGGGGRVGGGMAAGPLSNAARHEATEERAILVLISSSSSPPSGHLCSQATRSAGLLRAWLHFGCSTRPRHAQPSCTCALPASAPLPRAVRCLGSSRAAHDAWRARSTGPGRTTGHAASLELAGAPLWVARLLSSSSRGSLQLAPHGCWPYVDIGPSRQSLRSPASTQRACRSVCSRRRADLARACGLCSSSRRRACRGWRLPDEGLQFSQRETVVFLTKYETAADCTHGGELHELTASPGRGEAKRPVRDERRPVRVVAEVQMQLCVAATCKVSTVLLDRSKCRSARRAREDEEAAPLRGSVHREASTLSLTKGLCGRAKRQDTALCRAESF